MGKPVTQCVVTTLYTNKGETSLSSVDGRLETCTYISANLPNSPLPNGGLGLSLLLSPQRLYHDYLLIKTTHCFFNIIHEYNRRIICEMQEFCIVLYIQVVCVHVHTVHKHTPTLQTKLCTRAIYHHLSLFL